MREDLEGLMQLKELKLYLQLDVDNHFAYPIFFLENMKNKMQRADLIKSCNMFTF